ncbi:putative bifunctional diguanylate cyclase/phosphodiesterase [Salinispirillum marinum]|uniref:Bifunctional diguanylate cyclase/phosphodiesterase n=2 Tax=Saccharospirillaceae TaxID=255527 RepID=A0ABV8BHC3_9GAMM
MNSPINAVSSGQDWLNAIALPAMVIDGSLPNQPIQFANNAWWSTHHQTVGKRLDNDPVLFANLYRTTPKDRLTTALNDVLSSPQNYRTITVESLHNTVEQGRWYRHALSAIESDIYNPRGNLILVIEQDITWEVLNESRLSQQAALDPLTGLLAREPFLNELRAKLRDLTVNQGALCLVFIDLNKFKPINDNYGHDIGDRVLSQLGERLLAEMSHGNRAGRLGGDEFVLMLTGTLNQEAITDYLNSMVERVFQPIEINASLTLPIGASFGYACTQDAQISAEDLLKAADQAMYRAKQQMHASTVTAGDVVESREKSQNRAELVRALKTDGLEMYIQPVISPKHGKTIGFEVLPRWQHPEYGLLELEHFHPLLIHSEEGKAFDRWLILSAAKLSASFKDQGFDIGIGINLTRRQLDDGSFVDIMREAIPYFADGKVDLTLEIIESPHFRDHALAFSALQQAREMGGQVVLDHFGGNASSMTFAAKVPLDFIKLHHDLCKDLHVNPDRQRYVGALIAFAHELGLPVVASGIGSKEDAERLNDLNCDLIQGNLWHKPMTVQEAQTFFSAAGTDIRFPLRRA